MHVDLIEALRCPHPHADGWLVASADAVVDRRIVRGTIGCPTCGAEWRVAHGELSLTVHPRHAGPLRDARSPEGDATHETSTDVLRRPLPAAALDVRAEALRTAALLDIRDAHGIVVLCGVAAHVAEALAELTGVLVLVVNAPDGVAPHHSRLHVEHALPLGVGCVRGVAFDNDHAGPAWMASAMRAVARGGRVIAPLSALVPASAVELARDARQWVAEVRESASGLVPLRRAGDPLR